MCSTRSRPGLLPTMTGAASGPIDEGRVVEPESMPGEGASSTPRKRQKSKYAAVNQLSCVACHPCPLWPDPESARPQTYYLAGSAVPGLDPGRGGSLSRLAREINRPPGRLPRAPNRHARVFPLKYAQRQLGIHVARRAAVNQDVYGLTPRSAVRKRRMRRLRAIAALLVLLVIWLGFSVVNELVAARRAQSQQQAAAIAAQGWPARLATPAKQAKLDMPAVPAPRAAVPLDGVPAPADAVPEAVPDNFIAGAPVGGRAGNASSRTGKTRAVPAGGPQRWRSRIFAPRARRLRRRHGLFRWRRVRRRQRGRV